MKTREEEQRVAALRELMRRMKKDGVYTQKEFAKKCGVPETTLSAFLAGERPGTLERWHIMADAAGWKYEALLEFGEQLLQEKSSAPLYIVTQQNNRGVVTGVSNGALPPRDEIAQDLSEQITEKLKGKSLEERIALWNKIKALLEDE